MGLNLVKSKKSNMYQFIDATWNTCKGKCPHNCHYCLVGDTDILMSDFSVKKIKDVGVGDDIICISKVKKDGKEKGYYKFTSCLVTANSIRKEKTIKIHTSHNHIECTKDHPIMGSTEARNCSDWKSAGSFSPYENIRYIGMPSIASRERDVGWLSGFCDGDGCFFKYGENANKEYLGFEAVCVDNKLRESVVDKAFEFGIHLKIGIKVSSKRSFNKGKPNPMIFTRADENARNFKKLVEFPDDPSYDFCYGYIAGMIDSDGSTNGPVIRISQSKKANAVKYARIILCLKKIGLDYVEEVSGLRVIGGAKSRLEILFNGKPQHYTKSRNLLFSLSVKGTYHSPVQSISVGGERDVYNLETEAGNYIANGFIVHNCFMKRWGTQKQVRFDEKELKTDLGSGNFIFVGSSCDMFADDIPIEWITRTLDYCSSFPSNTYLFQTKNPERISTVLSYLPNNPIICTTIETNRWCPEVMMNSPSIESRVSGMKKLAKFRKYVTIEPIMDFDLPELVEIIKSIEPIQVNIGADSGGNNLPEPPYDKIIDLANELSKFTKIENKRNLDRLKRRKT